MLDMAQLYQRLDRANQALGKLEGVSRILPDRNLFLYTYVRKEAIFSSQIEGTQSSLSDLLMHENDSKTNVPFDDVQEVSCYVRAMNYGMERLKELPLSLRLIREVHAQLMDNARGQNSMPGEFRTSQNWIGGTRPGNAFFVPPAPEDLMPALNDFELFLHDDTVQLPILVRAALAHVQFETLHPFLDGNGRIGRLLITLMLCSVGTISEPLLYLSLYFKKHRQAYYDHLQSVRETGAWEDWINFFLDGVVHTAEQASLTAMETLKLFAKDEARILSLIHI